MSIMGTIGGILKAPFVFIANAWDGWSDFAGGTLPYFAIGGALLGGLALGGVGGMAIGLIGGAAASVVGGALWGAASGTYEGASTIVEGVTSGGNEQEVAEAEEPSHGLGAAREKGSPERAA